MGNNNSQPAQHQSVAAAATQRAAEEQRRRQAEMERQRKAQEEQERQKLAAEEAKKLAFEEKRRKDELERDLETRKVEYQHTEEMQRIANAEKKEERSSNLADKQGELEHARLMQNQEKVLAIAAALFQKVEVKDIRDAAFGVSVLQMIQAGKPVDKDVLKAVTDKVANPPPTDIKSLVDSVIKTCEEEDAEETNQDSFLKSPIPHRRSFDLVEDVE